MAPSIVRKVLNTLQITADYSVKPAGLQWRSNTLFIVATVAVGLFTDLFLYGLIVPILPSMLQDKVGVPKDQIQSNVSGLLAAYAGASVVFSPVAGIMADRMSTRQAPFLIGLLALFGATIMLYLGTTLPVLAIARVLQGISAAFVWTIGLALCLETVGPENLGKTIGSVSSPPHCLWACANGMLDLFLYLSRQPLRASGWWLAVRQDWLPRCIWHRLCYPCC